MGHNSKTLGSTGQAEYSKTKNGSFVNGYQQPDA